MATNAVWLAMIATLGTWFLTALGAATVLFVRTKSTRFLNIALGFATGVMIAASFWSLLQPAVEKAEALAMGSPSVVVTIGFVVGAIFLWASDKIIFRVRHRPDQIAPTASDRKFRRILMLVGSITLHNIPEGFAVGVAFGALNNGRSTAGALLAAISVAVGIGLQNFPEGAAVAFALRREGHSPWKCFWIGQASGMVEPIAGVLGAVLVLHTERILPFALSFAAGAMILVAVHELIPECQDDKESYVSTMGIITGFAVMTLLDVMLG